MSNCRSRSTKGPKPDIHGRTERVLSPLELLEALSKFVAPPRVHRHRYHGVLAPNARLRPHVVALGRPEAPAPQGDPTAPAIAAESAAQRASPPEPSGPNVFREAPLRVFRKTIEDRPNGATRSIRWAVLLTRSYDVLPLLCPACGGEMKILAFLTDPPVVSAILLHLDLPHTPPPLSPARGPPQSDLLAELLAPAPASPPASSSPLLCLVTSCPIPPRFQPRMTL